MVGQLGMGRAVCFRNAIENVLTKRLHPHIHGSRVRIAWRREDTALRPNRALETNCDVATKTCWSMKGR